jgi:hypothetical protein
VDDPRLRYSSGVFFTQNFELMLHRTVVYSLILHLVLIMMIADVWVAMPENGGIKKPTRIDAEMSRKSEGIGIESEITKENIVVNGDESLPVVGEKSLRELKSMPQTSLPKASFEPVDAQQKLSVPISETLSQSGFSEYRLNIARTIRDRGYSQQIEHLLLRSDETTVIVSSVAGRRVPQVILNKGSGRAQEDQLLRGLIQSVVSEATVPAQLLGKDFAVTLQFSRDQ